MATKKNPAAVTLGKLRTAKLSQERRQEIASLGGKARADVVSQEEAVKIARKAGNVGGRARAEKLSSKRRSEIARKAAATRWAKQSGTKELNS
jgi:hypothetical protein